MPRSSRSGDLFITVGGDITSLRSAMKAGKSVLNEFGLAAIDVQKEVDTAFANMAANAPSQAKKLEQSFSATFAEIRRNAKAVLNAPANDRAIGILNVAGAREAARAAEVEAASLRDVAQAAIAADNAAKGTNAGVRLLAVSAQVAAREAEEHAAALRDQANALELVQGHVATTATNQKQLVATTGAARTGMIQLGQQVNDLAVGLSTGQRPATVFAQQLSQITFALQVMSMGAENSNSKFAKFAGFLGGPWGIALTIALTVLAPLVAKLFEGGEAADKHRDAADKLAAALKGEDISTKALIESLRELNEQELKALDNDTKLIDRRYNLAKATLAAAAANKALLEGQLAQAKADLNAAAAAQARAVGGGKGAVEAAGGKVASAQAEVDRLQEAVDAQTRIIAGATQQLDEEMVRFARNASTAVGKVNIEFDRRQTQLERRFLGTISPDGKTITGGLLNDPKLSDARRKELLADLARKEHDLNVERQKAIHTAQELDRAEQGVAESAGRTTGELAKFIMPVEGPITSGFGARTPPKKGASSFHPAIDIGAPVGTPVHAAAGGVVIYTGKLGDLGNVVIVDHGGGTITEYGHLSKILTSKGSSVEQGDVIAQVGNTGISTGPHLDYRVKVGGKYVDPRKGQFAVDSVAAGMKAGVATQRLEDRTTDQDNNFAQQMAQLDEQLLRARSELLGSVDAQSRFASDQVEADRKQFELAVQKAVDDGKIRAEQGKELIARSDLVAAQQQANIAVHEFLARQEEIKRNEDLDYDIKSEALEFQREMARSSKERLDIQNDIIDAEYAHRRNMLEIARKSAIEAQNWDEVSRIDRQLAALPAQRSRARQRAERDSADPFNQYINSLPRSLDEVKDRLQDIKVTALHELEDSAARATTKLLGLKGPLGEIADMLIRLAFETALGSILKPPGRAAGGPVSAGSLYVVGENGPELFVAPSNGTIIPNHMVSASPPKAAALAGSTGGGVRDVNIHQSFMFEGVALTQQEFVQGLAMTKIATIHAIREEDRRR